MFELTRREQAWVAGFVALFLLGVAVKTFRPVQNPQPPSGLTP
jgi:hypothetical protein